MILVVGKRAKEALLLVKFYGMLRVRSCQSGTSCSQAGLEGILLVSQWAWKDEAKEQSQQVQFATHIPCATVGLWGMGNWAWDQHVGSFSKDMYR